MIRGKIETKELDGLPKVSVRILNTNLATFTDETGYFTLKPLQAGTYTIRISALGYASENRVVVVKEDTLLNIELRPVENHLDEAIVTAHKKEDDPHRVAASVSILETQQVEDQYIWNVMDLTALVPNLNIANPGDNRNVTAIRGVTTTSYNQAVATYVDGVNQFGLDTYIPYLMDVERIEILRGPQGMLYGRNAMAGVINIITNQPSNQFNGTAEVNLGNYGQQRYGLSLRTPVIKDKLFLGLAGVYNALDGFYTNDFDHSHYDAQHTLFGNYYLKYLPNSHWTVTLNFKHVSNRNNGAFALMMGVDSAFANPFHLNQNAKAKMIDNSKNLSLALAYTDSKINFRSQTAFQSNYRYYQDPIDADFSSLDAMTIVNNYGSDWNNVKVFTQEFNLSSATSTNSPFNWTIGSFLFHQYSPTRQGTGFGEDAALLGPGTPTNVTSILSNKATNKGAAVFGMITYDLSDKWSIQAGLRYDYEHARLKGIGEFQQDGEDAIITQADTSAAGNFQAFSPSINISYAMDEAHHIYGSYSRGFRTGGISPLSSNPAEASLRVFDPEYSNNIEFGSKNRFLNRIQLNVAAFYTRVNQVQVPTLVLPDAITVTQNTGRMKSMGLEMELVAHIVKNLSLLGSGGLTHARYLDLNTASEDGNIQLKGKKPVFTPNWTGSLGAEYVVPIGAIDGNKFQIGLYGKFVGQQYFVVENTLGQDPYALLNATIGYSFQGYEITLWGQNIMNKYYADYAYDFGFAVLHFGKPVTYGLTLRKRFG